MKLALSCAAFSLHSLCVLCCVVHWISYWSTSKAILLNVLEIKWKKYENGLYCYGNGVEICENGKEWDALPPKTPVQYTNTQRERQAESKNMNQVIIVLEKVPIPLYFFVHIYLFFFLCALCFVCLLADVRLFAVYRPIEWNTTAPSYKWFIEAVRPFFIRINVTRVCAFYCWTHRDHGRSGRTASAATRLGECGRATIHLIKFYCRGISDT